MTKYEIGKQIGNRKVITTKGEPVGQVYDIEIKTNGELANLVVSADVNVNVNANIQKDDKGRFVIPYSKVIAVGQYVLINE
ncbi:MAG: hypothetical protein GW779_05925 [Candidatus Altiarchaeum hamiconexum]|uniref:PRC-barrel domain-containing protein n=1 Tax=Candidatus Altarchaeum hamiconexum TaxID=1803513 RepID=A0A8J7YT38_9ARCH|nr:hypothetical protein [Candidatus Altarchaeum hamiconexum]OIQ05941.1 MAG: hypothetical protein AUK59_01850 [Candidatus Altarchaeum sp. CG2_30_32_3053]PIN66872.1 MAG: hypothetical protein COV98_05945 [Candidatus Altarchaeum sp. CG12_big_fil_rev_8_21_14_0_65_33_22]PIV28118.1 MAG: hypothetical protein COS36_03300 [Candidatus Altarchaeum sp. CG03_land_8_20_14_0_80_32_618]PIX49429.1 MAG: hypothetical protein COZ53_00680 [Candidatus Altarchaeum sp. CG_4_8_14_3_um_filter_33_2054]PIZ30410.1 MAG: hyp